MMGKDCERILLGICDLIDQLSDAVYNIDDLIQPVKMEDHLIDIEADLDDESVSIYDRLQHQELINHETHLIEIETILVEFITKMEEDFERIDTLAEKHYIDQSEFNNSYGSPWTELKNLWNSVLKLEDTIMKPIKSSVHPIMWSTIINITISRAIDAKWAWLTYHDYIQRGFDYEYNDRQPSVFTKRTLTSNSTGNVPQKFTENVNIPSPSIAPF